jgi:hypothetical protein
MALVLLDRVAAALALLAFALPEADARAAPPTIVALEYEVAPDALGCPGALEFRTSVERQLGYDPFGATADTRVVVQIERKEPGFEGRIRWSDPRGRWVGDRRLSSRHPECADIAASVAFSVAVQVQLLATLAPAPSSEPTVAPPLPTPPPVARAPEANATPVERLRATLPEPAARARPPRLSVGLGPTVALGVAPRPTGLGRLFVSGRSSWFSVELAADAALPATQRRVDGSGFSLGRVAAEAAACGHARAFAACLTTTVGRLEARGFGVDAPASPAGVFSQVGARIVATRDLWGHYFAAARVDGVVMTSSWTVTVNEAAMWTTPRVGALLGVDFGARFF